MKLGLQKYHQELKAGNIKRLNPLEKSQQNPRSYKMAITAKCYDCCGFMKVEVTKCTATDCPLHNLRPWQAR